MFKKTNLAALLIMALAIMATPVFAGDFQDGFDAYKRGDYETAVKKFKPLAEQGFAKAQTNLGLMYEYGAGVPQDYDQAVPESRGTGVFLWPGQPWLDV